MFWFELVVRVATWAMVLRVAAWAVRPPGRLLRRRRDNFTKWTGAYLDPHFVEAFDLETRRTFRWTAALVGALGIILEAILDLGEPPVPLAPFSGYSLGAAAWLAAFATTRLRSAGREFTVAGSRTAVARPRRVVVGDYVGWPLQVATWLLVAIDVALGVAAFAVWRRDGVGSWVFLTGMAALVVTLAMAGVTVWFARALCERPTPAVDPSHLYLQDAWRARSLSSAYGLVCIAGYLAFLGLVFIPDARWLEDAIGGGMYIAMGGLLVIGLTQGKWFRRRLWRGLPPGYVLLPGQPPPPLGTGA